MRIRGLPPTMLAQLGRQSCARAAPVRHVFVAICDHYEPKWNRPAKAVETDRVSRWVKEYPRLAGSVTDSRGRHPQHSFFYPQDEYEPHLVEPIADLCRQGWGDVEVHLHHDKDTADGLREKLCTFTEALYDTHGMLRKNQLGQLTYAFIHGNWALNNSRPDGRWCGVNDEISVLLETGCYADMTMPSAPAGCQTTTFNSIYYAASDPLRPMGHDRGIRACVGQSPPENKLLMVQGPLALDWKNRKWGLLPRIENGDLTGNRPPTLERLKLWLQAGVHVAGRPDWCFIKLHTHGAQERNAEMLLGEQMRDFHQQLARFARDHNFQYHYVTAYEMACVVRQAEQGGAEPDFTFRGGLWGIESAGSQTSAETGRAGVETASDNATTYSAGLTP